MIVMPSLWSVLLLLLLILEPRLIDLFRELLPRITELERLAERLALSLRLKLLLKRLRLRVSESSSGGGSSPILPWLRT